MHGLSLEAGLQPHNASVNEMRGVMYCEGIGACPSGHHLDQVPHRQEAHDFVVLRHPEVANLFLSHEPTGMANGAVDVNLNQGVIHHGPDAGAARREMEGHPFPDHIGLGHDPDHFVGFNHEE
jgi:hypothetical protein